MQIKKLIGHPIQLLEVVAEKMTCRLYHDMDSYEKVEIGLNFSTNSKLLKGSRAYAYLTVKVLSNNEPKMFSLEVTMRGLCQIKEKSKVTKRDIETQAVPLLLPYARETISNMTTRMGFPPLMLPVINVLETIKSNKTGE